MKQKYFWALLTLAATASACSPVQRCYQNADCESPMVCMPDGECDYKCRYDVECGNGFVCVAHECKPQLAGNLKCPKGMAPIQNTYCMDQYEASRPDATSRSAGEDSSMAMSRPGVMPWQVGKDNAAAKAACEAAGKRLCTPAEWEFSCHGANNTVYGYGNDYEPETCNGLEAFGKNNFHLVVTGTFKNCHNGWEIYDLNGNLWEHTANGNAKTVRGGAYNCADSPTNHQCSYVPNNWTPSALGFRCCSDGIVEEETPEPDMPNSGTPEPGTPEPGTPEPGTPEPGTPEPGTPEPDPGTPEPDPGTPEPDPGTPEPETPQYACPDDMVLITYGDFAACMDRYEAARSDATENFGGASTMPVSKAGVQPWYRPTFDQAVAACQSVGKHLCNADEWNAGCAGTDHKKYPYGNTYDPTICNGIDAYCACDSSSCAESNVCPFAHCYLSCGSNLRIMPTGSFENCTNDAGAYDISGNLWEFVDDGTGQPSVRGGAYNCIDSENLHQCSTIMPVSSINAYGFRCCKSPDIVDNADEVPQAQNISPAKIINFYHKFQEAQPPESFITSTRPIYEKRPDLWVPRGSAPWWVVGQRPTTPLNMPGNNTPQNQNLDTPSDEIWLAWQPSEDINTMADFGHAFYEKKTISTDEILLKARQAALAEPKLLADNSNGVISADEWYENYECISPQNAIESVQELWEFKETRPDALEIMKFAKKCNPQSADVERALGISYARMENYVWAMKSFSKLLADNPNDCETVAWVAWTYQQMAMPDDVEAILSQTICNDDLLQHRLELIGAMNDLTQNRHDKAAAKLESVYAADALYRSDRDALQSMQGMTGNAQNPNLSWKLEVDFGYASNALSSSPNDPSLADKETGSPLLEGDFRITLDPWKRAFARAVFEAQVTGQWLMSDDAENSSYGDIVLRPGVVVDAPNFKFGAYYRPEFLILHGGDMYEEGPILFYTSHRIELDFEVQKWLYIFAGYGHRTFRQRVRTRDEFDIGAGGFHGLGAGFSLTWGASYRHWFSVGNMYDLNGTNISLALDYRIRDVQFRLSSAYAFDDYANSDGYFATEARQDHALRGTFQVWSPALAGVRVGAEFKASRRWSSADDYDYDDYRGIIAIRWTGDLDFYAPSAVNNDPFALPWNLESSSSAERIRDIIQQDEDMQRSSSCLQN